MDTLTIRDFGRCHGCGTPHPLRLLDVVVLDRHGIDATEELFCQHCYPDAHWLRFLPRWACRFLRWSTGIIVPFSTWVQADGEPTVTRDELMFIVRNSDQIVEVQDAND